MADGINMAVAAKQLFRVRVDLVDVPADRLRTLKPEQARAIGEAIKADRQYDAIAVTQLPGKDRFLLVDGLHRLEGCRAAGIEMIEARLVSANRESRLRQEVLSAWARADHDAFDKAAQVAAMIQLQAPAVADEEQASLMMRLATGWDEAACEALGISRANLFRYLKIHRFYDDEQKNALRAFGLANELVPLIRLAALPPEDFALAFAAIGRGCTIAEALGFVAPAPVTGWDKQKAKVLKQAGTWKPHELRELIDELRALYRAATASEGEGND